MYQVYLKTFDEIAPFVSTTHQLINFIDVFACPLYYLYITFKLVCLDAFFGNYAFEDRSNRLELHFR